MVKVKEYKYKINLLINNITVSSIKIEIKVLAPPITLNISNNIENCSLQDIIMFADSQETIKLPDCMLRIQKQDFILDID